jgi:hypothetical protein
MSHNGWKPRHLHPRWLHRSLVAEQSSLIRGAAFCRIFQVDSILQRVELVATVESNPRSTSKVRFRLVFMRQTQGIIVEYARPRPALGLLRQWPRVRCRAEGRFSFHSVCRVNVSASSFRISFFIPTVLRVLLLRASAGCFSSLVLPKEGRHSRQLAPLLVSNSALP